MCQVEYKKGVNEGAIKTTRIEQSQKLSSTGDTPISQTKVHAMLMFNISSPHTLIASENYMAIINSILNKTCEEIEPSFCSILFYHGA